MKKKRGELKELERKYKDLLRFTNIILVCYFLLIFALIFILYSLNFFSFPNLFGSSDSLEDFSFPVTYNESFSETEINDFNYLISHLKPIYKKYISSMEFMTTEQLYNFYDRKKYLAGYNYQKHIYIAGDNDISSIANTICHEALHSIIFLNAIDEEKLVEDISFYNVCYNQLEQRFRRASFKFK